MEPSRASVATPQWARMVLAGILLSALWLRLDGIDWLLPCFPEPDNHVVRQLNDLEAHTPPAQRAPSFRRYPLLLADLARLVPAAKIPASDDLAAHLWAANTSALRVRILSAVLSSALVLLTWNLARRFTGPTAALLASAFTATSLLHVLFSQQARPHGAHATFALLAVLSAIRLRENPGWGSYALAGLACGFALACLQFGIATLLPLVAAHILRDRSREPAPGWRIAFPLAIAGSFAFAFYPGRTASAENAEGQGFAVDSHQIWNWGYEFHFSDFDGHGFVQIARYWLDHDPALLALAALGLALALPALARGFKDRNLAVVLSYAVPYLCALGIFHNTFERFLLPLLPYLACLAGFAAVRAADLLAKGLRWPAPSPIATGVAAAASLAFPIYAVLHLAAVRDAPDTVRQAARWIREHVDPNEGAILVTPAVTLPLFHRPDLLDVKEPRFEFGVWTRYQAKLPWPSARGPLYPLVNVPPSLAMKDPRSNPGLAERVLNDAHPAYLVLEVSPRMRQFPLMRTIRDSVTAGADLVFAAESEPDAAPDARPLGYQDMDSMLARLLRIRCFGPRIEIWRLRKT